MPKNLASTVAAAPLTVEWPEGYSGKFGVVSRGDYLDIGGGITYTLTGSVDVSASYFTMVWGKNIHKVSPGLVVGFTFGFSPQQAIRRFFQTSPPGVGSEAP